MARVKGMEGSWNKLEMEDPAKCVDPGDVVAEQVVAEAVAEEVADLDTKKALNPGGKVKIGLGGKEPGVLWSGLVCTLTIPVFPPLVVTRID